MARITDTTVTQSPPSFVAEPLGSHNLLPQPARVDAAQFDAFGSVRVTVGAAGAAQGATSIPVAALSGAIPSGTVLRFSADEFATLSASAAAGATSLAVEALVNALESGDVAIYPGTNGKKFVPAGTAIGRTISERDAGTNYGPATDTDDEIYLTGFEVIDANINPDVELVRHNTPIKENYLTGFAGYSTNLKTKLRSLYQMIRGVN